MVKIRELINPSILNSEWVGFQGDSEYVDEDGEAQLGYWTFKSIVADYKGKSYAIDDEVDNYAIYGGSPVAVRNENNNVCMVELGYEHKDCRKCKHNYQSYHCMGCNAYYGNIDDLEPFCSYCNNIYSTDDCENCVWNFEEV